MTVLAEQDGSGLFGHNRLFADLIGDLVGTNNGRTAPNGLKPSIEVRECSEILLLPFMGYDPGVGCHVGYGVIAGHEFSVRKPAIEHAVEPLRFFHVAVNGVRNGRRCILDEMMVLPRHWAKAAHLPKQPLERLGALANVGRQELPGLFSQIEQNGARFEQG